jgi:uncharacterized protein (TIGR02145 family)
MKVKYLSVLFLLFLCKFANGQVPGMPKILGKGPFPQVFTLSAELVDFSSAVVNAQVVNNGQTNVTESGIVWGTSLPITLETKSGTFTKTGSGAFSTTITLNTLSPNPSSLQTYYIVAYAQNAAGTRYGDVITYDHGSVTSQTGRIWLAYNLGATKIPTTVNEADGFGSYYQWGRRSDDHEIFRPSPSATTETLSTTTSPDNGGAFILGQNNPLVPAQMTTWGNSKTFADWLAMRNEQLWQGINGTNNPCPNGYRLPTIEEFQNEVNYFSSSNSTGAFASKLKLTINGKRSNNTGNLGSQTSGFYWTSSTYFRLDAKSNQPAYYMGRPVVIASGGIGIPTGEADGLRAQGMGVRCIKD